MEKGYIDYCSELEFAKIFGHYRAVLQFDDFIIILYRLSDDFEFTVRYNNGKRKIIFKDIQVYSSGFETVSLDIMNRIANFISSCKSTTSRTYIRWVIDKIRSSGDMTGKCDGRTG